MLADLGLREIAAQHRHRAGGAPLDGDIGLQADRLTVYVNLFADQRRARQAELGLRAKPKIRAALSTGATTIHTAGRVVYVATGRGGVVDEFRLDEVARVVGAIPVPPPLQPAPTGSRPAAPAPDPDVLEQLRQLGELRDAGVLTDAEFDRQEGGAPRARLNPSEGQAAPGRGDARSDGRGSAVWPVRGLRVAARLRGLAIGGVERPSLISGSKWLDHR